MHPGRSRPVRSEIVKLVCPRQTRTISGPRNRIDRAMTALSGSSGTRANPKVAMPSVMLWATVNAVIVLINIIGLETINSSPSTKSRWSTPRAMCWTPSRV